VSIDLSDIATRVPRPDDDARTAARVRLAELAPAGALGRLGELAEWIAGVQGQCPARPLDRVRLVAVTRTAEQAAAQPSPLLGLIPATTLRLVEGYPRLEPGDDVDNPPHEEVSEAAPVDRDEVDRAFEAGIAVADEEADDGADLLLVAWLGVDSAIPAAAAVAVLAGADVASVVGRGTGIDDREWMRRCAAVRDVARVSRRALADGADVLGLLSFLGSAELAVLTGLLCQAAIRRTPAVLDGTGVAAAALVAHRLSPRSARWLIAGLGTLDPGQTVALQKIRLQPLVDYAISTDDGTGALLAVPHLQAAARLLATTTRDQHPG
jgi:nicotinate-nucleotide--dimethylbenzimidazole phosphoribosyltransferase